MGAWALVVAAYAAAVSLSEAASATLTVSRQRSSRPTSRVASKLALAGLIFHVDKLKKLPLII
jgi:hypothetical protein